MKQFVSELEPNKEALSFFVLAELPALRKSKKDKDYLCLKFSDRTGTVDGRMWEVPKGLDLSLLVPGAVVKAKGTVSSWNDQNQISVTTFRLAEKEEYDELDMFERSLVPPEEMWEDLGKLLTEHMPEGPIAELLRCILQDNEEALLKAPAAKTVHHNYIGGLLEHVLSMCRTSVLVCERYGLSKELVLAACCLHDVGKVRELSYDGATAYTVEGTLLGHISIGMEMVSLAASKIPDFPQRKKMELLHMVASHHGLLEYGSPKVPLMREAIAFHIIDKLDATLAICDRMLKGGVEASGLTAWGKEIGGPLYSAEVQG